MPRPSVPAWFAKARLGMFMHYGLYSLVGENENEVRRKLGRDAYSRLIGRFDASSADPTAWARLAADSGCTYLVLTVKHGEGFCLWPSAHTSFHIGNSPCRRDLVAETVRAVRAAGLRVGLYFGPQSWISDVADDDPAGYRRMVLGQLGELLGGRYGKIDLLWLDDHDEPRCTDATARMLVRLARRLQPGMVINDRGVAHRSRDYGDYSTPERFLPDRTAPGHRAWEGCDSIGVKSWGWHGDERFWSVPELARRLATAAARGGRYLLNVQPEGGGRIRPECVVRMQALGRWAAVHRRALAAGECALQPCDPHVESRPALGVATTAPGRMHLLLTRWPSADEVVVPQLGGKVRQALLGLRPLRWRVEGDGLHLWGLPAMPPSAEPVEIEVRGALRIGSRIERPVCSPGALGIVRLGAERACCEARTGVPAHHRKDLADGRCSIGFFFGVGAAVSWALRLPRAGRYRVVVRLARPGSGPPAGFALTLGRHRLAGDTVSTADWNTPADIDCGTVTLAAGAQRCTLRVERMSRGWFADVHEVLLVPRS
jgi:alpha-L-fucosidase